MGEQRTEDLNPGSEDVEEKVRRMMDPSVPDEPAQEPAAKASAPKKSIEIQAVSAPAEPESQDLSATVSAAEEPLPSAPELPSEKSSGKAAAAQKPAYRTGRSKKVIIPISHNDEPPADDPVPESETPDLTPIEPENIPEESTAPPIKQITITEHDESTESVAEKLDEVIAELDTAKESTAKLEAAAEIPEVEAEALEPSGEDIPVDDPAVITDPKTDKAVEEIVAAEGDELLEIEDAVRDTDEPLSAGQRTVKKPRRNLLQILKAWWKKPAFRRAVIAVILISALAAAITPTSRYFVLNTAGVRAASSLVVLDESTQQPLKNVQVKIGGSTGTTDEEGKVSLKKVKLGRSTLTIEKRAFAPVSKTLVVGWGSNPLGDFSLTPTGTQYSFAVTDFLSGKALSKVEATSGDASAVSDDKGNIKLTIDKPTDKEFTVSIKADGQREEKISLDPDDKTTHSVKLVAARKQVFVSKRSGKYDIYSVYMDGKDEKLVLAGTGNEKEGMVLVPHPSDEIAAYVSTRGGQHNSDGFLLSNLILINLEDNTTALVGASERIQIVDWSGDRLIYVQIAAGASANSPKRYRLMSYDYKDASSKELASSNYFNDVVSAASVIYYAPSSAYQTGKTGLFKINPDGSSQQTVFDQEVWNIFRTAYDHFALSVQQQWYDYRLGHSTPAKLNSAPANQTTRVYMGSPDGAHSAWVDSRDGKGTLLIYDTANKKDATLHAQSGLGYPVRWLNNQTIVYRVKTDQETADYAISIDGGKPVKIRDVTNSGGINSWYN